MMGIASPTIIILPDPDGTIDAADRAQLMWLYSGLSLAEAIVSEPSRQVPRPRTLMFPEIPLAERVTVAVFISWSSEWTVEVNDTVTTFEEVEAPIQVPMLSLDVSDSIWFKSAASVIFKSEKIQVSVQESLTTLEFYPEIMTTLKSSLEVSLSTGKETPLSDMIREIVAEELKKERIIRECEWLLGIGGSSND